MVVVMVLGRTGAPVAAVIRCVGARVEKDVGKRSSSSASSPLPSMEALNRGLARQAPPSSASRPTQVSRDAREEVMSSWKANSSPVRRQHTASASDTTGLWIWTPPPHLFWRWPLLAQGGVGAFGTDGCVIWKVEGSHPSTTPKPVGSCSQREQRGVGGPCGTGLYIYRGQQQQHREDEDLSAPVTTASPPNQQNRPALLSSAPEPASLNLKCGSSQGARTHPRPPNQSHLVKNLLRNISSPQNRHHPDGGLGLHTLSGQLCPPPLKSS